MIADHETALIGPITDSIIDADRLVREQYGEVFPNFDIYRLILCRDRLYMSEVRQWWVGFCVSWSEQEMARYPGDELITVAAWDSLQRTVDPAHPILTDAYVSVEFGIGEESYRVIRKWFGLMLSNILRIYWERMVWSHVKVKGRESRLNRNELRRFH